MADDILKKFQDEIRQVFMGTLPSEYASITSKELKNIEKIVTEEGILEKGHFTNYVTAIQRIGAIFGPRLSKQLSNEDNAALTLKVAEYQQRFTILLSSMYHKEMQNYDTRIPLQRKIDFGNLLKRILLTFKDVYRIELMIEQDVFIQKIDKNNDVYRMCIDIAEQAFKDERLPEVLDIWKYSPDQLAILSQQLLEHKFIDSDTKFLRAFTDESKSPCNWLKSTTSFMFLIALLFKGNLPDQWSTLFNLLSERFTFKQKTVTPKMLRETMRNVDNMVKSERRYLSGEYGVLRDLYDGIIVGL